MIKKLWKKLFGKESSYKEEERKNTSAEISPKVIHIYPKRRNPLPEKSSVKEIPPKEEKESLKEKFLLWKENVQRVDSYFSMQ